VFGLLKAVFEVPARELIDLIIIYSNAAIIWKLSIPRVRGFQIVDMPWLDNICAVLRAVADQIVHGLDLVFQCGGSGVYLIIMWWVGVTILIQIIISSGFMISLWSWIHKAQHDIEQHTTLGKGHWCSNFARLIVYLALLAVNQVITGCLRLMIIFVASTTQVRSRNVAAFCSKGDEINQPVPCMDNCHTRLGFLPAGCGAYARWRRSEHCLYLVGEDNIQYPKQVERW
jgi:hypothetical protein